MIVHYSESAREEILSYYGDCQPVYGFDNQQTDLKNKRTLNYRKISNTLRYIDDYLNQTYTNNGKKFIDIGDFATVEFKITENNFVFVKHIYFKDSQTQTNNYKNQNTQNSEQGWQRFNNQYRFGFSVVQTPCKRYYNYMNQQGKVVMPQYKFTNASPANKIPGKLLYGYEEYDFIVYGDVEFDEKTRRLILSPKVHFVLEKNMMNSMRFLLKEMYKKVDRIEEMVKRR